MQLKQEIAKMKAAAKAIIDKAKNEGRDLTADEQKDFDDCCTKAEALQQILDNAESNTKRLDGILAGDTTGLGEAEKNEDNLEGRDLGQRFVSGLAYKAWHKTADTLGTGGAIRIDKTRIGTMDDYFQAKAGNAIGTPIAHLQPTRMPAVDLVNRPAITLLDLISRGSTKGDFEYLQILSVTRNTGIIPENTGDDATDTQKPQSTFSTALADAKVYGYADGYTVTNQLLEDDSAMASFLQNEFDYSFQLKLADMLLNGTGTNGQPKGLLNTTGVQAGNWTKADDEAVPDQAARRRRHRVRDPRQPRRRREDRPHDRRQQAIHGQRPLRHRTHHRMGTPARRMRPDRSRQGHRRRLPPDGVARPQRPDRRGIQPAQGLRQPQPHLRARRTARRTGHLATRQLRRAGGQVMSSQIAMRVINGIRYRPEDAPRHAATEPPAIEVPVETPQPEPESETIEPVAGVLTADEAKANAKATKATKKEA